SNHLDARHRQQLYEQLQQWRGGLLVISHDRELLAHMQQILDEPSNHLDARHRQQLYEQLQQWRGGLLVISHDREL
ncbi:hypothetical protein C7E17_26360, partial [Stenotrophomonas maltophilia]